MTENTLTGTIVVFHDPGYPHAYSEPAFLLDQRQGRFAGGRWLISAWQPSSETDWLVNAEAIRSMISLARVPASSVLYEVSLPLPPLSEPGLYRIEMLYRATSGQQMRQESGFWIWDTALVEQTQGKRLTTGRDYFYQEGQIFPVFGTTYMDSQVQRKFLTHPPPGRWDRDFAEMKANGINLIRTGIWTAWRVVARQPLKDGVLVLVVSEIGSTQRIMLDEGVQIEVTPDRAGAVMLKSRLVIYIFGGVRYIVDDE